MSRNDQPAPRSESLAPGAGVLALVMVVGSLLPLVLMAAELLMRVAVAGTRP
jgi:hypothetical protein